MDDQMRRIEEIETAVERGDYMELTMDDLNLILEEQDRLCRFDSEETPQDSAEYQVREHYRYIARRLTNLSRACHYLVELARNRAHELSDTPFPPTLPLSRHQDR